MTVATRTESNVEQAVPFFWVHDIEASHRFYIGGLELTVVQRDERRVRLVRRSALLFSNRMVVSFEH